jgi:hypothetical protein
VAWSFPELPYYRRSSEFLTGWMARGLAGVAVSDGKMPRLRTPQLMPKSASCGLFTR